MCNFPFEPNTVPLETACKLGGSMARYAWLIADEQHRWTNRSLEHLQIPSEDFPPAEHHGLLARCWVLEFANCWEKELWTILEQWKLPDDWQWLAISSPVRWCLRKVQEDEDGLKLDPLWSAFCFPFWETTVPQVTETLGSGCMHQCCLNRTFRYV